MSQALARGIQTREAAAWQMIASSYLLKQMEHVLAYKVVDIIRQNR